MPGVISFRPAAHGDIPALQRLIVASVRAITTSEYTVAQREEWIRVYVAPATLTAKIDEAAGGFVLAVLGGEVVGSGALHGEEIHAMYVDPHVQGRGIGAAIVRHLEDRARRNGSRSVHLDSSIPAVTFYERLGYRGTTPMTFDMAGTAVPGLTMVKDL